MSERPLTGRHVVTTRDARGRLDSLLAQFGADVIHVPLISIERPADGGAELATVLAGLDRADWLIVTSHHGAAAVGSAAATAPSVRLAAVGSRTSAVLSRLAGRAVDIVPDRQTAADLVAAMPPGGGRIVVAQADRADSTLVDGLRARGHDVDAVTAYRTVLRSPSGRERRVALTADAVVFASGSAAEAWASTIGPTTPIVAAAIGPSTAAAARRAGLKITHVAADHHVDGLVATTVAALARHRP